MIESEHCANWHFKYNILFCRDNFNKKYLVRKKIEKFAAMVVVFTWKNYSIHHKFLAGL